MGGKTLNASPIRKLAAVAALGVTLAAALALGGCSAGNITGFDFPVFGLTKKSNSDTAAIPSETHTTGSIGDPQQQPTRLTPSR